MALLSIWRYAHSGIQAYISLHVFVLQCICVDTALVAVSPAEVVSQDPNQVGMQSLIEECI